MTRGRERGRSALVIGGLLLLTAVAYRGVTANGFVYDDRLTVVDNAAVRSLGRAPEWFWSPHAVSAHRDSVNYRPVAVASYAVDHAIWGGRASGFHAMNVAIHLGVILLVYALARRLWGGELSAFAAAAWMALHPINAEAVTYISARSSTLAAGWVLVALLLHDHGVVRGAGGRTGRVRLAWSAGALGAGLLALGAKESAAVLPLLVLAWDRARFGASETWSASVRRSVPFWGLLGAWLVVRRLVLGGAESSGADIQSAALFQSAGFAARIIVTAAWQSAWPVGFAADYGWPVLLGAPAAWGAIVGAGGLVIAGAGLGRIDRRLSWCAAWAGLAMLPVLALPFITRMALYQEHRVYLAQIGVAWLVGGVAALAWSRRSGRLLTAFVAIALILAAVGADGRRVDAWRDSERLWEDVLAKYPESAVARGERGTALLNAGRLDEAEQEFVAALRIIPTYVYLHLMLGRTYGARGDLERAANAYRIALAFRPGYVEARIRLGLADEGLGRSDQALAEYARALHDDPRASPARVFSADLLGRLGRTEEAIRLLDGVEPDDPISGEARSLRERLAGAGRVNLPARSGAEP